MDSKHKDLIREAIKRPLPQGTIDTRDVTVGAMSSIKLNLTMQEIEEIVNELLIAELVRAEVNMSDACREDITDYRDERIADLINEQTKWRWYCVTCGKLTLQHINEWIPEDERYCECD